MITQAVSRTLPLLVATSLLGGCAAMPNLFATTASMNKGVATAGNVSSPRAAIPPTGSGLGMDASGASNGDTQQGTGLKGGEVDDNVSFADYLDYVAQYVRADVNRVDVSERDQIFVLDEASKSLPNATVSVTCHGEPVFTARSASNGRALFFPRAYTLPDATTGFEVRVDRGDLVATASLARGASQDLIVTMPITRAAIPPQVDICFALDVTGSMGDELLQIQKTISAISSRIKSLPGDPTLRLGLVAYRDVADDFVTKTYDFTSQLDTFQTRLNALAAVGGGDYPESVNEALNQAVNTLNWDTGDTVRLLFVVGDAPPHMDYLQDIPYSTTMFKAVRKGIKICPLAASGLDDQGEYIFRQLAQTTGGKFLFLTYGGKTQMDDVGPVQSNNLDDLVVGIVKTELASLQ